VVNLDARRVIWIYDRLDGQPCARDVFSDEARFVGLVERAHLAAAADEDRGGATIGRTAATRLVDLDGGWHDDGDDHDDREDDDEDGRSLAVALVRVDAGRARLSNRERRIAQLLAGGYSVVNAAAILSLSESTIRTYVRRIYQKLEITNRADLTRKAGELCLY
jgi:DNA-binding NarL/FixJ family response regulator